MVKTVTVAILEIAFWYILGQLIGVFIIDVRSPGDDLSLFKALTSFKHLTMLPLMSVASLFSLFMFWLRSPLLITAAVIAFAILLCKSDRSTRAIASVAMGVLGMIALASIGH